MRRLFPTGPIVSAPLAALVVFCLAGLAGAQPNAADGSAAGRPRATAAGQSVMIPEIVPLATRPNNPTSQTAATQGVVVRPSAPVADGLDTTIPLSLNQVPLDQLVRFMADTTGKTVIKQRDLNTQISVNAPKPVTKREALELIYSALQLDNIYVAEQDGMMMLINFQSLKNIRLESIGAAVDVQALPDSLRIVQKIYKFENINPASIRSHLDMFMPNTMMTVEPQSNTLIITDQLKRIKAYDKIIKALDTRSQDRVLDVYKLGSANANDLASLLRNLIQSGALAEGGEAAARPARGGSDILLIPDWRLNWIIALCPKNQKAGLDQLVAAFDVSKSDDYIVQIYKLEKSDANQITGLLNNVINSKGLSAGTAAPRVNGTAEVAGRNSAILKRLADQLGGAAGRPVQSGDVLLIPESRLNWIIAIMRPDLKDRMDELVKQFDVERKMNFEPRVLKLKTANASNLYGTVMNLISGLPMNNSRDAIRITPSQDNSSLIVMASESNYKLVEELVDKVQTMPENRIVQIYKLNSADASQLYSILQMIISNHGLKGDTVATMGNWGQPGDVMLYPEYRQNWLIAILRPDLKPQLDALVKQFDTDQAGDMQARTIELKTNNALALRLMVQQLVNSLPMNSSRDYVQIIPSDDGKKLIVMSSAARFKTVQELVNTVQTVPTDKVMQVYSMKHADVTQMASFINTVLTNKGKYKSSVGAAAGDSEGDGLSFYVRRMVQSGGATNGGDVLMIPETRLNCLVVIMKPEIKIELDKLIEQFDVQSTQEIKPRLLDLKGANSAQVAATVSRLLAGRQINSAKDQIQVMPSDDGKQLIVMSTETNYKIVEEMVATVAVVPASKTLTIYKLVNARSSQLISLINSILATRGISTSAGGSSGVAGLAGDDGGFRYLRRMMTGGGNATGASGDVLMIPESRLNWIIAITKPEVKPELDALVKEFDVQRGKDVQTRMLDLKGANAQTVAATIERLIAGISDDDDPKNVIRVLPADDNRKLIVMSSEENFKTVEEMVATVAVMPSDRAVGIYKLVHADAAQLIPLINSIFSTKGISTSSAGAAASASAGGEAGGGLRSMRRMMTGAATGAAGANAAADVILIPEARLNWIIAMTQPALKAELEALIKQFDVESSRELQARLLPVKTLSAQAMATMVNNLISARTSPNSETPESVIRVMPADDNQKLIVMSSEAGYKVVQDLVQTLDAVPDDRVVETYKLKFADAGELTALLQNVIAKNPLLKGAVGASASTGNLYARYSRTFSGDSYGGSSGGSAAASAGGSVQIGNIILIPDTRLNWIVVICPKDQKTVLDKMILDFDIEKPKDQQARVIELRHTDASDLARTLTQILRDQAGAGRRESVRISATDDGSKLLVWSTEANFKDIQKMVLELDVIAPKDVQVRMIDVQYAEASQLATTINNLFRDQYFDYDRKREYVRVSATEDGARLMVMSSEANFKTIQEMISKMDIKGAESQVTKVYKVENLEAQDMADQLVRLFEERSKSNNNNSYDSYYSYYYSSYGSSSRSAQLPQPAIVPSPRNNTVMVMARPKDMDFLEQMIKELDVPIDPADFEPRIYHIRNTDAAEVVNVLENLFSGNPRRAAQTTNYYYDSWRPNRNNQNKDAIEAVFGKLRFVVDRQTNTIVALSSNTKNYKIIDNVIAKLDQPDPENSEVMVYDLMYADALKISNQLNYLFSQGQTQRPNTPQSNYGNNGNRGDNGNGDDSDVAASMNGLEEEQIAEFVPLWGNAGNQTGGNRQGGDSQRPINSMIGSVRVVPDVRSNKLMVAAPPVYFPTLTKLIVSLDHNQPQVYITTRIVELTRGKERRIGIRWTPDPNSIEPGELDNAMLALGQLGFIDTFGHGDRPDPAKIGAAVNQTLPAFGGTGVKTISQTLKNGNSVLASNVNIGLLVQLLVKNSQSRIYTEPGVTVNNNETGNIFFGSEFPFQTGVLNTDNGNQNISVEYEPVGIKLDIRPHINSNEDIVLKAAVENSNVRSETVNGQLIKDIRRFTTEVSLKNNETMVIGGILTDDGSRVRRGVPVLSSIPVIKYLFSKKDDTQSMRELVFFVTPQIIESAQDSRDILARKNKELKNIEELDPKNMDSLRGYQNVPGPVIDGDGIVPDPDGGDRAAAPARIQLHRRPPEVPEAITLSDVDKQEALKALKEVEYESRRPGASQSGSRRPAPRPASLPAGGGAAGKPSAAKGVSASADGLPSTLVIEESNAPRKAGR